MEEYYRPPFGHFDRTIFENGPYTVPFHQAGARPSYDDSESPLARALRDRQAGNAAALAGVAPMGSGRDALLPQVPLPNPGQPGGFDLNGLPRNEAGPNLLAAPVPIDRAALRPQVLPPNPGQAGGFDLNGLLTNEAPPVPIDRAGPRPQVPLPNPVQPGGLDVSGLLTDDTGPQIRPVPDIGRINRPDRPFVGPPAPPPAWLDRPVAAPAQRAFVGPPAPNNTPVLSIWNGTSGMGYTADGRQTRPEMPTPGFNLGAGPAAPSAFANPMDQAREMMRAILEYAPGVSSSDPAEWQRQNERRNAFIANAAGNIFNTPIGNLMQRNLEIQQAPGILANAAQNTQNDYIRALTDAYRTGQQFGPETLARQERLEIYRSLIAAGRTHEEALPLVEQAMRNRPANVSGAGRPGAFPFQLPQPIQGFGGFMPPVANMPVVGGVGAAGQGAGGDAAGAGGVTTTTTTNNTTQPPPVNIMRNPAVQNAIQQIRSRNQRTGNLEDHLVPFQATGQNSNQQAFYDAISNMMRGLDQAGQLTPQNIRAIEQMPGMQQAFTQYFTEPLPLFQPDSAIPFNRMTPLQGIQYRTRSMVNQALGLPAQNVTGVAGLTTLNPTRSVGLYPWQNGQTGTVRSWAGDWRR